MAVREWVIKIPEGLKNDFESEQWTALSCMEMKNALEKATPLPKGHGRIGDLDALREEVSSWGMNDYEPLDFIDAIDEADTIIEADRGEVESRESENMEMTLDEAIKHAEEEAKEQDKLCKRYDDASRYSRSHSKDIVSDNAKKCLECFECSKEHRQLAEWLKELKRLREQTRWIPVSERLPENSGEYLVTVIDEDDETYRHTGIAWYSHPKDYDIEEGDWRELMINENVVAWMPLPKPYKADRAESEG